jgi:hypothetical protein
MTTKSDFILNEALSMSPAEKARIAHCLISSLSQSAVKKYTGKTVLDAVIESLNNGL